MTEHQAQNVGFRVELIKVFNAMFGEIADMMECDPAFNGEGFTKMLSKTLTMLGTMSHTVSDEEREHIRHEVRSAFIDLIDTAKHYGLMAIYDAGEPRA